MTYRECQNLFEDVKTTFGADLESNLEFFPKFTFSTIVSKIYDQAIKEQLKFYESADYQIELDAVVDEIIQSLKDDSYIASLIKSKWVKIDQKWHDRIKYLFLQGFKERLENNPKEVKA